MAYAMEFILFGAAVAMILYFSSNGGSKINHGLKIQTDQRLNPDTEKIIGATSDAFLVYFFEPKMLVSIHLKSGSASFWVWMYKGLTNKAFDCDTYVQNVQSPCWSGRVVQWQKMSNELKAYALTDPLVLRVALYRDPFDRTMSCWKSKFSCPEDGFKVDIDDQERMMTALFKHNAIPRAENQTCLSISQYAQHLDILRERMISGKVPRHTVELHLRPQIFYFNHIKYSLVLDIRQMTNGSAVVPLTKRLPFIPVGEGYKRIHSSRGSEIAIPEKAAKSIAQYSALSEYIFYKLF